MGRLGLGMPDPSTLQVFDLVCIGRSDGDFFTEGRVVFPAMNREFMRGLLLDESFAYGFTITF